MIGVLATLVCLGFFSVAHAADSKQKDDLSSSITIESYLQGFSSIPSFTALRDPFLEVDPPYKSKLDQATGKIPETLGPLERFPVTSYKVVAVLLNDERPRALVRVPEEGGQSGNKLLIVRLKDKLGNRSGVITRMDEGMIYVTETTFARRKNVTENKVTILKMSGKTEFR